ncbi:MAG TPA: hypothetical protein VK880_09510 [Anaerolineales bacterium]|nr:hypothetical protein [Anaerolineales bacterium]
MDSPLTPEQKHAAIEDALQSYPVMPMPRDITLDVMSRVQTVAAPRRFRLTWHDLILSTVLAFSIGAVWFSLQNLPPLVVAQIRKESILLYQQILVNGRWLLPAFSFGLAGFFAALTIPYLRKELVK